MSIFLYGILNAIFVGIAYKPAMSYTKSSSGELANLLTMLLIEALVLFNLAIAATALLMRLEKKPDATTQT
ncbi:MAG: hypothetical protein HY918_00370 [Candidatus Doudnabacteria bacterium]|nr:hypothetical protein [Candidatus Doudnabacteria bacterium]